MSAILSTIFDQTKTIATNRCRLELLLDESDAKTILSLKRANLKNDYIKPLFINSPKSVDKNIVEMTHNFRFNKNLQIKQNEGSVTFQSLYYLIRLRDTNKIIGSLEICDSISEKNCIGFGLFIDKNYSSQGYGREALTVSINFLKQFCSIRKLRWDCFRHNARSVSVAKKCGFVHDGNWVMERDVQVSTFYLNL